MNTTKKLHTKSPPLKDGLIVKEYLKYLLQFIYLQKNLLNAPQLDKIHFYVVIY